MTRAIAILALGLAVGCASQKTCEQRANEAYQHCVHPQWTAVADEPAEPVRGDKGEECQASYKQSMSKCAPNPEPPIPDLKTSTTAR